MGVALSGEVDCQRSLDVVMLLSSDGPSFCPVSILDFVSRPSAYLSRRLVLVEPKTIIHPSDSHTQFISPKLDFEQTMSEIRSFFTFRLVQGPGCRLWISVPVESDYRPFVRAIKDSCFTNFRSTASVSFHSIFSGFTLVKSVSDVFRVLPINSRFAGTLNTNSGTAPPPPPLANNCDLILPNLYIGGEASVLSPAVANSLRITHIVTLCSALRLWPPASPIQRRQVLLPDSPFAPFTAEFWAAVEFVSEAVNSGGVVLIQCQLGISRSPALCIAYLIEKQRYTFERALALVTWHRPAVMLNPGFVQQLVDRARQILVA
jgi:hypothetical protein